MATSTKSPSKQPPKRPSKSGKSGLSAGAIIGIVVGAVVLIAGAVAIMASLDDGGGGGDDVAAGIEQVRPVNVDGTPLPPLPDDPAAADPALGLTPPSVEGASFDGTPVSLSPGAPTLAVYLAHWCPHCQREVPVLVEWQASGDVPDGLDVIGVSTGVDQARPNYPPSTWLEGENWPWPVLADSSTSEAASAAGLTGFPYMVLTDADGTVVWRHSGEISSADLSAAIDAALPDLAS